MGKYEKLSAFLRAQRTQEVAMTFREIEKVVGFRLPDSARSHRAWWSNNPTNNVMTGQWLDAGFETEQVDMGGERLVFRRKAKEPAVRPAKTGGRHPLFGALKGMVRITPGTDLTAPADPEWGSDT